MPKIQIHDMSAILLGRDIDNAILNDGVIYKVRGAINSNIEDPVRTVVGTLRVDIGFAIKKEFPR